MDNFSESFNEHAESLREERQRDDFDNLQHSLSGVETGQQARHGMSKDTSGSIFGDKRKTITEQIRETLEWLLLNNPAYAEVHEAAMTSLRSAETTVTNALDRLLANLEKEQAIFNQMLERAASLPDGRKVFRDAQGQVKTLDGQIIDNDLVSTIQWRGDEPSYEEVIEQKNYINDLQEGVNEVRGIETELGGIRGELTNNEKPPTQERVDELHERIQELNNQADTKLKTTLNSRESQNSQSIDFNISDLQSVPIMPPK